MYSMGVTAATVEECKTELAKLLGELDAAPAPGPGPSPEPTPPPATGGALPGEPVAFAPAPGSSGTILVVGPSRALKTIAAALASAKHGDTLLLDPGRYSESITIDKAVVIDGGGKVVNPGRKDATYTAKAVFDYTPIIAYAQGKGGLILGADCIIRGVEIKGCGIKQTSAQMTSAIRNGAAGRFVVEDCYLHDNQCGVGSGGYACVWTLKNCLFVDNGLGDGQTHNVYVDGGGTADLPGRIYIENVTSTVNAIKSNTAFGTTQQNGGHALKSRMQTISLRGNNYLMASDGSPLDMPDGTSERASIINTIIEKPASAANHRMLSYAVENQNNGTAGVLFTGCTMIASCPNPFVHVAAGTLTFENCTKQGNAITKQGNGTVVGL
jgi:hypothetical protein